MLSARVGRLSVSGGEAGGGGRVTDQMALVSGREASG